MTILVLSIIFVCLVGAAIIIVRKFPELVVLNVETAPEKRTAQAKKKLLERRLKRVYSEWRTRTARKIKPFMSLAGGIFANWQRRLLEIYERLRPRPETAVERDERVKEFLARGRKFLKNEQYDEAEKVFIETLKLDRRNIEAFRGLGDCYIGLREYKHARETYEFLLKLIGEDAGIHTKLGAIAHSLGDWSRAEEEYLRSAALAPDVAKTYADLGFTYQSMREMERAAANFLRAVELEPNNPRYLDFLLEVSILMGNLSLALETFEKLRAVNPGNNKLSKFRKKIRSLQMKQIADEAIKRMRIKAINN